MESHWQLFRVRNTKRSSSKAKPTARGCHRNIKLPPPTSATPAPGTSTTAGAPTTRSRLLSLLARLVLCPCFHAAMVTNTDAAVISLYRDC
ncbi:hypothetical protein BDR05DRAFT_82209 [Suillus weaverae]|nr:hypothetical protein BDR05DRAFT_82209 [Suillus weaverae]